MFLFRRYPVLATILKPFHKKQKNTIGLVTSAIIEANSAGTMNIAGRIARWLGILFVSALNRLYRLLRNHRIDYILLTKQLLRLMARALGNKLLIAIDWTEWHNDLRMLTASVVADKRAIPVQTAVFHKSGCPRGAAAPEVPWKPGEKIAKFPSRNDPVDMGAWEWVVHELAGHAGVTPWTSSWPWRWLKFTG